MMAANLGKPSTRFMIRASYAIELTTLTLRPKLRIVPRMSHSMSISLRCTSLRLVSSIRCSWETNVFTWPTPIRSSYVKGCTLTAGMIRRSRRDTPSFNGRCLESGHSAFGQKAPHPRPSAFDAAPQTGPQDALSERAMTSRVPRELESTMGELRYPNESAEYRKAREALHKDEQDLIDKVKALAQKRRMLPPGGRLKQDYVFQWASEGKVGQRVRFSELFGDKPTLLLYSWMFGPSWDKPCPSCTSLMDGFDRTWYSVAQDAAFAAIAKAPVERISAWTRERGWSQIPLLSGFESPFQADYRCQGESDDMQWPVMHVFTKRDEQIVHFWGTETMMNHVDTVWPYWNLFDFTPEGRPDRDTPPQRFRSEFLENNYLDAKSI